MVWVRKWAHSYIAGALRHEIENKDKTNISVKKVIGMASYKDFRII